MTSLSSRRESNLELARVLAMSAIMLHHFLIHALRLQEIDGALYLNLNMFVFFGVDVFFLITGFFGIRLSLVRVVKFIVLIAFFDAVNVAMTLAAGEHLGATYLLQLVAFPVSHSRYWFMQVYLLVMLMSPFLNASLAQMRLPALRSAVLLLSCAMWYSCTIGFNESGRGACFLLGLYLYIVGGWLRRDIDLFSRWSARRYFLLALAILVIALVPLNACILLDFYGRGGILNYTGVFMTLASCAILLGCVRLSFRSALVNRLGFASVGCYLLQDGIFGHTVLYAWQNRLFHESGSMTLVIWQFVVVFLLFWLLSWPLTAIARRLGDLASRLIPARLASRFTFP